MNNTSYHPIAKFCHWAIVLVIAVQFVSSWFMAELRHGGAPNIFNSIHISGWSLVAILLATGLLFMRFYKPVARTENEQKGFTSTLATLMQYALYILLFIAPLSGWAKVAFSDLPITFLGLFDLPLLSIDSPAYLVTLARLHGDASNLLGILALGHMVAALYHHFIVKDTVLERMRPVFLKKIVSRA